MFRSNSPFSCDTNSHTGSMRSNGYSTMDETSSEISNLSRPSAKSIYLQRRHYAAAVTKMMEKNQYRVEHLFTCDLDGKDLSNVRDCVERLKLLDQMGRVWGQNMMLEVQGANLLLSDIETKEELESISLSHILELNAVLNIEGFSSLLIMSVQLHRKPTTIFMFQCEEIRADYIEKDLKRALANRFEASDFSKARGQRQRENGELDESKVAGPPEDYEEKEPAPRKPPSSPPPPKAYTELQRKVDILNHILNDVEVFIGRIAAAGAKNLKKNKKKKKAVKGMPSTEEFAACLQKIKYGFNLLGELNGLIKDPSAADFVHSLFSTLKFVVPHCAENLPQTIIAPLFTPQCIRFMSEEATPEEDQLWQSLGDPWNIPSTQWPEDDEDIPTYTLEFYDGWQPPEVTAASEPESRQESPEPSPSLKPSHQTSSKNEQIPRDQKQQPQPQSQSQPQSQPRPQSQQQPRQQPQPQPPPQRPRPVQTKICDLRVKVDFISRNSRELTVRRGEMVELLDKSKQWWKVRNSRGEEGYVPNNVLEDEDEQPYEQALVSPVLTKKSKPAEVKAWLEDKGFSPITVRCLGVLSGSMLLGMSREELKTVCQEEGGRVFFQLQAVRSALANNI
ncbi:epidermal growth factor receptor kinase substrate 8-like protein 3 isoform X2 [Oryzias latipes]|uniref:epidermal growth factor receptor kinase substrate 8-like protein 3 isoform X2 n=1 Tax=Oryzias latipes TaxID=8090 RepID=UPI0005CB9632|nr:epidermal growth factor receptor kinase substrate 8-like protein 3 isoform X2 [Oryzias latipes]